jgi:hypothetical protein
VPDEGGDIERQSELFELAQKCRDVRGGPATVPRNNRGDALTDKTVGAEVSPHQAELLFKVRVDINEAWGNNQSFGVNRLAGGLAGQRADLPDAALPDAKVRPKGSLPGAIHNESVGDEQVKAVRSCRLTGGAEKEKRRRQSKVSKLARRAKVDRPAGFAGGAVRPRSRGSWGVAAHSTTSG